MVAASLRLVVKDGHESQGLGRPSAPNRFHMATTTEVGPKKTIDEHFTRKRSSDKAGFGDPRDDQLLDELLCPIGQNLPIDPVTAEDGRVYDRSALQQWFTKNPGATCKSPSTGVEMGKKLTPAYQIRTTIERLVDRKVLVGDAADEWKRITEETKAFTPELKDHYKKAEEGEAWSMGCIGFACRDGTMGAKQDKLKAAEWFTKASRLGDPSASQALGVLYARGDGVRKDKSRGILELVHAAMLGSEHGAVCVANHLVNGEGIRVDNEAALFWYKKSLTCRHKDTLERFRENRDAFIEKHDK